MVKKCNVLTNNEAVTVIDYDGTKVQIPPVRRDARTVNVIFDKGHYIVVDDNYVEPVTMTEVMPAAKPKKKRTVKKTTTDKGV